MADEYDESAQAVIDAIAALPKADVYNVTPTVGRVSIDFALGKDAGVDLMKRATGGRFGSSIVVDTTNAEVITATLRYGSLGLPKGGDVGVAAAEVQKRVEKADPPVDVSSFDKDAPIYVRFRDMSTFATGGLSAEGNDILHVVLNGRVPVDAFIPWFKRFTRLWRSEKEEIRRFTEKVGYSG